MRGIYECIGRTEATCGGNPNCNWQSGANSGRGRCIRQVGHLGGEQYQGPMMPGAFGKRIRRYNVAGSPCNKIDKRRKVKSSRRKSVRKPPAALLKRCRKYHIKTTKKVGKHRVYKSITVLKKLLKKKLKKKVHRYRR